MSVAVRPVAGLTLVAALLACSLFTAAPARAESCPGADATGGGARARTAAVLCLTAQARRRAHRTALRGADALRRSAALKVDSIEQCGTFTHTPCGHKMTSQMSRTGYARGCFSVGENLAWADVGTTPRQVVQAWLDSPGHRANLLDARFRDTGVASKVVTLADAGRVELWVQHFGTRC
ncbi:CAP domain-containing protein [Solirubrobacter soli]|uniref:CAP domain-containing protein n=1 Tax=Solirubrobacter soli TaxID=363832 RepID=UPI000A00DFCC|nr:CAP domain-containing protein [Solirubrobacter soli]